MGWRFFGEVGGCGWFIATSGSCGVQGERESGFQVCCRPNGSFIAYRFP